MDHLQELNVGLNIPIELLEHFPAKLNGDIPLFLFRKDLKYPKIDHNAHIILNGLLNRAFQITQNNFHINPTNPHVVLLLNIRKRVYCLEELHSNLLGR